MLVLFLIAVFLLYLKYPEAIRHPRNTITYIYSVLAGGAINDSHGVYVHDKYSLHLDAAERYGLKPIKTRKELKQHIEKGYLIKVRDNNGYILSPIMQSDRVLTRSAYEALQSIGERFVQKAGESNYFIVSSLTRTVQFQNRLAKSNVAAIKGISSHNYGCSFDISYIRFNGINKKNKELQRILENILLEMRKEEKILLIAERDGKCYHITAVRKTKK